MNNRHIVKNLCIFVILIGIAMNVQAQAYRTGYFLKANSYAHRINPSFQPDRSYLSFPILGNTSVNASTNFEITDFIYPKGGSLVTFMHPDVDAGEFSANLNKNNNLNFGLDITPFSLGFYAFGGFNTIDIGMHFNARMNIPKDMFYFMKDMGAGSYTLDNINVSTRNYAEVALGHSHKINENLTIGARLKLLLGLAYAEVSMDKMGLTMNDKMWTINANGRAAVGIYGCEFTYGEDDFFEAVNFSPKLSNLGFGVDLGVTYDFSNVLTKGLVLSASVNDINFIRWNNVSATAVSPDEPYSFKGFNNVAFEGDDNAFEEELESIGNDLSEFFAIDEMKTTDYTDFWGATLNIGLEYKMPFYDKLSVGALFTQRFETAYSYTIGSLMLNLSPISFFNVAASASVSTYGFDYGAMLNINFPGFGIFAGANMYVGRVGKIDAAEMGLSALSIPLDKFNTSAMFGINIPLGKKK